MKGMNGITDVRIGYSIHTKINFQFLNKLATEKISAACSCL